jgi:peptide/nickel transport system permease protein
MTRHALRPSSFSLLTVAGLQLAQMVGGTVVIETLFGIPGLGALLIQSVLGHDLVMVQGVVVVIALGYLVINLIVDVSYRLLDPRVSV